MLKFGAKVSKEFLLFALFGVFRQKKFGGPASTILQRRQAFDIHEPGLKNGR
jgi:hypothetical protein